VSNLNLRSITGKDGQPVYFPSGIAIGSGNAGGINEIGIAGQRGFGVGICPGPLPSGMIEMYGTRDPASDNYGNYQYSDGSVMVWMPAYYYKYGTGSNGLTVNIVDIKPLSAYATLAAANAAGYALHRAFYDGGAIQAGVFVDKYLCSNNAGTASSLRNGNPLSSALAHNPFNGLTGTPANTYAGAIAAAKTRGANFFCNSLFVLKALALLSLAHGQASTSTTFNAWYSSGSTNYPKGCNNNALGDANDPMLSFIWDGYAANNSCKTGSANLFARTTHNGQNCGVADLNGCMWEITPGLTANNNDPAVGNFYVLKTATAMRNVTGGNSLATDLWGATGRAALYDDLGAMNSFTGYALNFSDRTLATGSASQVLSAATSGTAWQMTGAGIPLVAGGSNMFGNDILYDYSTADLCPVAGGAWYGSSEAGVWALALVGARSDSADGFGFRAALYL
jgi:hypothetical protein